MNPSRQRFILLLILGAVSAGLASFAWTRFRSGELYPAYSTLRAEPDGAKALFASLGKLNRGAAARNLDRIDLLSASPDTTVVFLGAPHQGSFPIDQEKLEDLARSGGRVVIAIDAQPSRSAARDAELVKAPLKKLKPNRPKPAPPAARPTPTGTNVIVVGTNTLAPIMPGTNVITIGTNMPMITRDMHSVLGLSAHLIDQAERETNRLDAILAADAAAPDLPNSLFWYGRFYFFTFRSNEWKTVYTLRDKPVVLTRRVGLGSITAIADSFPFSNEGLHVERSTPFLVWVLGSSRRVVFDETHLGVERGTGVSVLMREYRMHGLVAGALLLVTLWIWRNGSPLAPPPVSGKTRSHDSVEGKTAREGIVHLLRRNISEEEILRVSLEEWVKAFPTTDPEKRKRIMEAHQFVEEFAKAPKNQRNLATYQHTISTILFPKRI